MNISQKLEYYRYNKHEITRSILLSVFILVLIIITFVVTTDFRKEISETLEDAKVALTPRYWFIEKVTPDTTTSNFTLNMKSNVGNVRTYSEILSYGLSQNGQLLTIHNNEGVFIINLEDESKKNIKTPQDKFSGDVGEVIDWNKDDSYFVLPVLIPEPNRTEVWVYTKDGDLYTTINADIPVSETGKTIVEPVYFSKKSDILLTRTYKKDDLEFIQQGDAPYSIYDLPVYLNTFNLKGDMIQEYEIRDYETEESNVIYFWDENSNYIQYNIYTSKIPDISKDYLFTKLAAYNE